MWLRRKWLLEISKSLYAATARKRPLQSPQTFYNRSVSISRRRFFTQATAVPLVAAAAARPLRIVVTGGHPGDPECGCAGTITRYTDLGHQVALLYLNRGEGFCGGASLSQCGAIRTAEARKACDLLKARAIFADQYDGRAIIDAARYETFAGLLSAEDPDIVFTHWPLDSHRDHRAISMLALDAWLKAGKAFALYYYEVAEDTTPFSPTDYVDISTVESRRRAACYAHTSQQPDKWYPKQVEITRSRGIKAGFPQAEAFLRHPESKPALLP
jgi:LmbE family N-acetylglucosaminyl deacetylase